MKRTFLVFLLGFILAATLAAQRIQVTSPAAGAVWPLNSPQTITWTQSGTMDDRVFIRLFRDGDPIQYITENTDNDGSFPWTIPGTLTIGDYTIRVRTLDRAVTGDSVIFTIGEAGEAPPPSGRPGLQVLWPNGGEIVEYGSSVKIRWVAHNMSGASPVDISLFKGRNDVGTLASGLRADSGSFAWPVGKIAPIKLEPGADYRVRLRVHGTAIGDDSDLPFAIALRRAAGDLELKQIKVGPDGNIRALVRSTFPSLNRRLTYEIERPVWAPTRVERKYLVLDFDAPGEKEFALERVLATDLDMSGNDIIHSDYKVVLDPEDVLDEANENNNRRDAALCGHAAFPVIEGVIFGTQQAQRNQTLVVRNGNVYEIYTPPGRVDYREIQASISARIRNYGYGMVEGHLHVTQIGTLPKSPHTGGAGGGTLMEYREKLVAHPSCRLPMGNPSTLQTRTTLPSTTFYMMPSDILVEFVWEGPGAHTHMAKFRFTVDFSQMPLD